VISRVAVLNRAWYEWEQHAPLLLHASDVIDTTMLPADYVSAVFSVAPGTWSTQSISVKHKLALQYTDSLTLECEVPDVLMNDMKLEFNEREIMEITAAVAGYNCVSRFLVALDIGERLGDKGMAKAIEFTGLPTDSKPAPRTRKSE